MTAEKYYDPADDTEFTEPFTDIDEVRESSGIRFRYFHGAFRNTSLKFSFCFPEKKEDFKGRFFQYLSPFPGPDEETASLGKTGADDMVAFAVGHGAAFVESNMASAQAFGNSADCTQKYRSSACTAMYCRRIAREKLGYEGHVFGYVYGGSGGAYKTFSCIEQTKVWEGAVPVVPGCPAALPNVIFVRAHALRILRHRMDDIIEAVRAGSLNGIEDHMDQEEKEAFHEVTAMGYPPEAWRHYTDGGDGSLAVLAPGIKASDPTYFTDFWEKEGYLGAVRGGSAQRDRISVHTTIREICLSSDDDEFAAAQKTGLSVGTADDGRNGVASAWKKKIAEADPGHPYITVDADLGKDPYDSGLTVTVESGSQAGKTLHIAVVHKGRLYVGPGFLTADGKDVIPQLKVGDSVFLDNSDYIAIQTYHRHQVPNAEYKVWDQFRDGNGWPEYPQREKLLCYGFAKSGAGSLQNGRPTCKVISMASLADDSAFPWMADWYAQKVSENYGEKAGDLYRLWYNEHSFHGYTDPGWIDVVTYLPQLYQALLDVADWAEKGIVPSPGTKHEIEDGQVMIPARAGGRGGIQPSIELTANGKKRAEVKAGETVCFRAECELPAGTGRFTGADLSFDMDPSYPVHLQVKTGIPENIAAQGSPENGVYISADGEKALICSRAKYEKPGTFYAYARIRAQRQGKADDLFTTIMNISEARIVVG
ncbi:MAG: hypothetical protein LKJ76_03400 [Lachnospiraceae bacterium]|jgi:hypothetical protein|nr:hypothetical protein [Lachnospiraceae bacterium]